MSKVDVVQQAGAEVTVEVLADAIVAIASGIKRLRSGRLNEKALVLLIQNAAPSSRSGYKSRKASMGEVEAVLAGIEALERTYLKKKPDAAR
jgi:hypothetical protein